MTQNRTSDHVVQRINLFIDSGINLYFSRVYWSNFSLKKDLQLAGYMSKTIALDVEIGKAADWPEQLPESSTLTDNQKDNQKKFNDLTRVLNTDAGNIKNLAENAWNRNEQAVMEYFNSGLNLYLGGLVPGVKGYFINHKTNELVYSDGKNEYKRVYKFTDINAMKSWAPELFNDKTYISKIRTPRIKLTSEKLIDLFKMAQQDFDSATKKPDSPNFHITINIKFINLFEKIKERMALNNKHKDQQDNRTAEQLTQDIITPIQNHIAQYKDAHKNNRKKDEKIAILNAIDDYLNTGDDTQLKNAVATYDSRWLSRMFSFADKADRTIMEIRHLQKSDFFTETIKMIKDKAEKKQAATAPEKEERLADIATVDARSVRLSEPHPYQSEIQDFNEFEHDTNARWSQFSVTNDAFKDMLTNIRRDLQDKQKKYTDLPKISRQIALQEEFSANSEKEEKKTVIEHILDCVDKQLELVERDDAKNKNFQSECAFLEINITKILNDRTVEGQERLLLSQEMIFAYNDIGIVSIQDVATTVKNTPKPPKIRISVEDVKEEIKRITNEYHKIDQQLSKFNVEFRKIGQSIPANAIESFRKEKISPKIQALADELAQIENCKSEKFDRLKPTTQNQKLVSDAVVRLQGLGNNADNEISYPKEEETFMDEMITVLNFDTKHQPYTFHSVNPLATLKPEVDDGPKAKFTSITEDIKQFSEGIAAQVVFKIKEEVVEDKAAKAHEAGITTSMSKFGLHKNESPNRTSSPPTADSKHDLKQ